MKLQAQQTGNIIHCIVGHSVLINVCLVCNWYPESVMIAKYFIIGIHAGRVTRVALL